VWLASQGAGLTVFDSIEATIVKTLIPGASSVGLASPTPGDSEVIWVTGEGGAWEIDPDTLNPIKFFPMLGHPTSITEFEDEPWIASVTTFS
jgi:hypothetical protein